MSIMIQVRNVPDPMHRKLKARAAMMGTSMSEYILRELARSLERPTRDEWLARLAEMASLPAAPDFAAMVREERDAR